MKSVLTWFEEVVEGIVFVGTHKRCQNEPSTHMLKGADGQLLQ